MYNYCIDLFSPNRWWHPLFFIREDFSCKNTVAAWYFVSAIFLPHRRWMEEAIWYSLGKLKQKKNCSQENKSHLWLIVSYRIVACSCFLFQNWELTMLLFTRFNKNSVSGEKTLARTCHCYSSLINLLRSWASIFARSFVKGDGQQILNLRDQWFGTYTLIQW